VLEGVQDTLTWPVLLVPGTATAVGGLRRPTGAAPEPVPVLEKNATATTELEASAMTAPSSVSRFFDLDT
jgi:hypothetical protein